ncbi:MAG: hypothetical protein KGS72_13580 [Cyanobacteria bacterium REEB67]|nr:hypothetical protein [Cyanobacteria bacterium REEB67]
MDRATDTAQHQASDGSALSEHVNDLAKAQPNGTGDAGKVHNSDATAKAVSAGTLPAVSINFEGQPKEAAIAQAPAAHAATQPEHHWYSGAIAVTEDLAKGAYHELKDHPLRVAESFAIGAGAAALATVVAPEVAIAATVAGLGYGAYQIGKNAGTWIKSAEAVASPDGHSAEEMAKAHKSLEGVGAGATDLAAGVAGGLAYRAAASAISSAMNSGEAGEASEANSGQAGDGDANGPKTPVEDNVQKPGLSGDHHIKAATGASTANTADGGSGSATPGDGGASGHATVVQAHHAVTAGVVGGDPSSEGAAGADSAGLGKPVLVKEPVVKAPIEAPAVKAPVEAPAAALTPEQMALANSVKNSQSIFDAANSEGGVVESTKQLYNVRFDKVTEDAGRRIFTLENRTEGVIVPKGAFVATRLDAAGNPVIEDGITNSWSMQAPKIAKTYQVDPATLENSDGFVAPTKVGGPSVHMVQLDKPTSIITAWGEMKGKVGDWLANYDFDKASGTPGKDYAIVSGPSYKETYQPVQSSTGKVTS